MLIYMGFTKVLVAQTPDTLSCKHDLQVFPYQHNNIKQLRSM